jgi:DNA repair exonuclease SbcCD ATPase subunit
MEDAKKDFFLSYFIKRQEEIIAEQTKKQIETEANFSYLMKEYSELKEKYDMTINKNKAEIERIESEYSKKLNTVQQDFIVAQNNYILVSKALENSENEKQKLLSRVEQLNILYEELKALKEKEVFDTPKKKNIKTVTTTAKVDNSSEWV